MKLFKVLLILSIISSSFLVKGQQSGTIDPSYNPLLSNLFGDGTSFNDIVRKTCIQQDGKVLVGGDFYKYNGFECNGLVRVNQNGTNDDSFQIGIFGVYYPFSHPTFYDIKIQADGKILIAGDFSMYNILQSNGVIRVNPDGSTDTSFHATQFVNDTLPSAIVRTVTVLNDGKILIGGSFSEFNGVPCNNIARLNPDGTVDSSFNSGTGVFGSVFSSQEQIDGKLLVFGAFTNYNGTPTNGIIRLNPDGSIDPSYNVGSGFDGYVYSTVLLPNSKLLAAGQFNHYSGSSCNGIVRLNADGTIDNTFSSGSGIGNVGFPSVYSLSVQADNKLLIGGDFTSYNGTSRNGVARLNANGSLDNTFNPSVVNDDNTPVQVYTLNYQTDGNVIIGGKFDALNNSPLYHFGRFTSNGVLDTTFNFPYGMCGKEFCFATTSQIQTDNK